MMIATTPSTLRWHALRKAQGRIDALIVVLARRHDLAFARALAQRWGEAVPHGHFVAARADFQAGNMPLDTMLWGKARTSGLQPSQIILVGVEEAARCAFDLVVNGSLAGLSAILVDMAPALAAPVLPAMGAALRFVRHARADEADSPDLPAFEAMIHGLRQASFDLRTITLPEGPDPASRAIGTFLIELVARVSLYRSMPPLVPAVPPSAESQP